MTPGRIHREAHDSSGNCIISPAAKLRHPALARDIFFTSEGYVNHLRNIYTLRLRFDGKIKFKICAAEGSKKRGKQVIDNGECT